MINLNDVLIQEEYREVRQAEARQHRLIQEALVEQIYQREQIRELKEELRDLEELLQDLHDIDATE